jgi:hypothetical protein
MKKPQTSIDVTLQPHAKRYDDFAALAKRHRQHISFAVQNGQLNWGVVNGLKMVVMDELADTFLERCRINDKSKKINK